MLDRFVKLQRPVLRVIDDELRDDLQPTRHELAIITHAVQALKPFEEATVEMSGEKMTTLSKVIPMVRGLQTILAEMLKNDVNPVAIELKSQLTQRFPNPEESQLWGISTYLDPRFKGHVFQEKEALSEIKKNITDKFPKSSIHLNPQASLCVKKAVPASPQSSIWSFVDTKIYEVQTACEEPTVKPHTEIAKFEREAPVTRDQDPLIWWKLNGATMPELQAMSKQYLSCPATSTPSERLFSKAGELINQRRANISDRNINSILFLNKNLK